MADQMTMITLGDIILGDDSQYYVDAVRDTLANADIRIGQIEVPYTERNEVLSGLSREPFRLEPLAGLMDIMTASGNHLYDAKEEGIEDTNKWLEDHGILHTGSGMNLKEARTPAIFEKNGVKVGVLNYNCIGPQAAFAGENKPGGAYIRIFTNFSFGAVANPGGPAEIVETSCECQSLEWMLDDIRALRDKCDILCVYFHKGIVHKAVKLAEYESFISHLAIDAGADVIFSSHAHILHGIEIYKGKTIYHGLGNGIAWVPSLSPNYIFKNAKKNDVFDPQEWNEKRIERFGFVPDPEYPTYPFHPEAIYTIFAKCFIEDGKIVKCGCVPAIVGKDGATRVVTRENGGEEVFNYVQKISDKAHLNISLSWEGDDIIISEK